MPPQFPRSGVADVFWPALPVGPAALALSLQYQLRQSERWDPAALEAHQFRQLEHLLAHAHRVMPFWRHRLTQAGIRPGETLSPETWSRIPILRRTEAQDAGSALICRSIPPSHGAQYQSATSGSTGSPLPLVKTEIHMVFWRAFLLRDLLWHQLDLRARWAALRRDPWGDAGPDQSLQSATKGPRRYPDLGADLTSISPTGPLTVFEIRAPAADQAAWLLKEEPDYLSAFPSSIVQIAQRFRDLGTRPKRLRAVRTASEAVTPAHRALIRETLGTEIQDAYSAEEIGYMALQCPNPANPDDPDFHIMAEGVKLEILDADDKPCPPGVIGRVVVTPLHNFAMPLIRYELGDYAEFSAPCPCGRGLPTLRAIRGRLRHGLIMPDGSSRAAYFGISFNRIPAIRQFQAAQITRDTIELRLVTRRPLTPDEEAALSAIIRNDTHPSFQIRFAYVESITRQPSGKYEEFRCELAEPPS